jgi:hypothetical protein
VHCYIGRLYRKLQVQSRSDLLIAVFRTHLQLSRLPPVGSAGDTAGSDA